MSVLGGLSASNIFNAAQKNFQAKAQAAWKGLATPTSTQGGGTAAQSAMNGLAAIVDPETREKLLSLRQQADTLKQRLSAGGESSKETAARKAIEAKEKLKMLKMQAQLAAASGDKKAAARIAKEAAQLGKELGQAARDYGADSGGTSTATTGKAGTETAAIPAEASASSGSGNAAAAEAQAVAQQAAATASGGGGSPAGEGESGPGTEGQEGAEQTAAATATDEGSESGEATAQEGDEATAKNPADAWNERRAAMAQDFAARREQSDFANGVRETMTQLRTIVDQMKHLAQKDDAPGTKAQMEEVERDMAEGEQALAEATSTAPSPFGQTAAAFTPPPGSLVQLTV